MKLRIRLAVLFYEVVILLFVCFLALFVAHQIPLHLFNQIADIIYYEPKMRLLFGLIALLLLIKTHLMAKTIYGIRQKERNIAFDNPAGRVSVSLSAMEDLIRRVVSHLPEVKDSKVAINAGKKNGLDVVVRLVLNGDINIPEMTARIQKIIQRRIQDMVGLEETVSVEVDVVKFVAPSLKTKKNADGSDDLETESNVPFQGYRA